MARQGRMRAHLPRMTEGGLSAWNQWKRVDMFLLWARMEW